MLLAGASCEEQVHIDQRHYKSELHVKEGCRFGVFVLGMYMKGKNKGLEKKKRRHVKFGKGDKRQNISAVSSEVPTLKLPS